MGLFDFFKKKKQSKKSVTIEELVKVRKDEGISDDDIKEEIMSSITIETSVGSTDDDYEYDDQTLKKPPKPKGIFDEEGVEECWDKSIHIEFDKEEGDLESIKYWEDKQKEDKENYYYGKKKDTNSI